MFGDTDVLLDFVGERFDNTLRKSKISGHINADPGTGRQILLLYNKFDGELLSSYVWEGNGDYTIRHATVPDESLLLTRVDETGTYFAESYDRMSLCVEETEHGPEFTDRLEDTERYDLVLQVPLIYRKHTSLCNFNYDISHENLYRYIPNDWYFTSFSNGVMRASENTLPIPRKAVNSIGNAYLSTNRIGRYGITDDGRNIMCSRHSSVLNNDPFNDGSLIAAYDFREGVGAIKSYTGTNNCEHYCSVYSGMSLQSPNREYAEKSTFLTPVLVPRMGTTTIVLNCSLLRWDGMSTTSLLSVEGHFDIWLGSYNIYITTYYGNMSSARTSANLDGTSAYTWHNAQLVVTVENGVHKIYLNGVLRCTRTQTTAVNGNIAPYLSICPGQMDSASNSPRQYIRQALVFNRILDPSEFSIIDINKDNTFSLPSIKQNNIQTIHKSISLESSFGNDRTNGICNIDDSIDYEQPAFALSQTAITGKYGISSGISLITQAHKQNLIADFPFSNGNIGSRFASDDQYVSISGIKYYNNRIVFDGSANSFLWRGNSITTVDATSNVFDESNIDIYIKFVPNSIGTLQCIWKSGNNTTGLAVGLNTTGNVVLYSRNSGALTSVVLTHVCAVGAIYKFVMTDGNVYLYDESNALLDSKVNGLTIPNSTGHESVGAAITGSPISGTTGNKEFFIGEVYEIVIAEKNTLEYKSTNPFDAVTYYVNGAEVSAEVISYDFDNNDAVVWINIPFISPFEDTVITIQNRTSTKCGIRGTNNARTVWGIHGIAAYHTDNPDLLVDSTNGRLDGMYFGIDSTNFASGDYGTYVSMNGIDEYGKVAFPVIENSDKCAIVIIYTVDTLAPSTLIDISTDSISNKQISVKLTDTNTVQFSLFDSAEVAIGQIESPAITANTWNITGFTYNGKSSSDALALFHNYTEPYTASGTGARINYGHAVPMHIGCSADDTSYFNGKIAELFFFESDISQDFITVLGKSCYDALGYYENTDQGSVRFTIPSDTVTSCVYNVPIRMHLSSSCGVTNSDVSAFFELLATMHSTYIGKNIKKYDFGSTCDGHDLNYKSIKQDSGVFLEPNGSLWFDGYSTCSICLENTLSRAKVCSDFSLILDGYFTSGNNNISSTYSGKPIFGVPDNINAFSVSTQGTYLAYTLNDNGNSSNLLTLPGIGGWNSLHCSNRSVDYTSVTIGYSPDCTHFLGWSPTYYRYPHYSYGGRLLYIGMNRGDSYRLEHKLSNLKFYDIGTLYPYPSVEVYHNMDFTPCYTGIITADVCVRDHSLSGEIIEDAALVDSAELPYTYSGVSRPWNTQLDNYSNAELSGSFITEQSSLEDEYTYSVFMVHGYVYKLSRLSSNQNYVYLRRSKVVSGSLSAWELYDSWIYPDRPIIYSACVVGPYVYAASTSGIIRYFVKDNGDIVNPIVVAQRNCEYSELFIFKGHLYQTPNDTAFGARLVYYKINDDYTLGEIQYSDFTLPFPIRPFLTTNCVISTAENVYLISTNVYKDSITSPTYTNPKVWLESVVDRSTGIIVSFRECSITANSSVHDNEFYTGVIVKDKIYLSTVYDGSTAVLGQYMASVDIVDGAAVTGYISPVPAATPTGINSGYFVITSNKLYWIGTRLSNYGAPSRNIYSIPFNGGKDKYTEDVYGFRRITNDMHTYQNANPHIYQKFNASQSGAILGWAVDGAFPLNIHKNGICSIRGKVFSIGGNSGSTSIVSVYSSVLDSSGEITTWVTENALPVALEDFAVLTTANRIYVIGGYASGTSTYSDKIYTTIVANDGQLGSWELCANTLPDVLSTSSIFVNASYVYLLGGKDADGFTNTCYRAKLNDAGELGVWTIYGKNAPYAASGNGVFVVGEFLYFCGGDTASGVTDAVYRARVLCSGELGPWTANSISLPKKLTGAVYITSKNNLYIYGGKDNTGNPSIGSYIVDISNTIEDPISVYSTHNNGPNTYFHTNALITSSKLYFIGGHNGSTVLGNIYSVAYQGGLDSYETIVQSRNVIIDNSGPVPIEIPTVDPVRFNIWYSVCIDGKTYKIADESGNIHSIASSDSTVHGGTEGDFYYYDEPDAMWRFANTVDIQGAISKALEFPNNRMKKDKIQTNGLLVGQTIQDSTKLHIAASMDSDDTISPYVYRIEINKDQAIMISYDYPVYQYCDTITQARWTFPVLEPFAHVWDTFLATTKVYCKFTTDTTWTLCTDESIPILPVGTVTAGKNIHFRIILDKTALDFVECAISIFVNIQ